jgi:hypothetical protein
MMKCSDEPQNITNGLLESLNLFDASEPMCSGAREVFRNEIVPQVRQLLRRLLDKHDLDAARALVGLFDTIHYFAEANRPNRFSTRPDDEPFLRMDLDEDEQGWRP